MPVSLTTNRRFVAKCRACSGVSHGVVELLGGAWQASASSAVRLLQQRTRVDVIPARDGENRWAIGPTAWPHTICALKTPPFGSLWSAQGAMQEGPTQASESLLRLASPLRPAVSLPKG
jgi:hypothetical protein